jgi:hypothetical protein
VCELFLLCVRWKSLANGNLGAVVVNGDPCLNGKSPRGVGREKFWRLPVLEFAWGMAYRGRGGAGCAFCCARCLEMERGLESSGEEEDWILRRGGRALGVVDVDVDVDIERGTTGEKLPGARCPVDCCGCDMVVGVDCEMHKVKLMFHITLHPLGDESP